MPVLLKRPSQPPLNRLSACVPAAFLFRMPALVNTGERPPSIATGVAWVLPMLNTPPASLTNAGETEDVAVYVKKSRSSPPRFTVPALSQRRESRTEKLPPARLRSMLVAEPAGVISVPLPPTAAAAPLAVSAPVTTTVPLPPSAGLAPVSVRLAKVVLAAASRLSVALLIVRLAGRTRAPSVLPRFSVPPVRPRVGAVRSCVAARLTVPADTVMAGTLIAPPAPSLTWPVLLLVRLGRLRLPLALTVSEALPSTVVAGSVVAAPTALSVTFVVADEAVKMPSAAPPTGACASVRVPPPNARPVPAASEYTPVSVPAPCTRSVPAPTLTVPVLLKLPAQPLKRTKVCVPPAVLLSVPALVNTGYTQQSMSTGVAWLLARLNTPPAWLTKVGARKAVLV